MLCSAGQKNGTQPTWNIPGIYTLIVRDELLAQRQFGHLHTYAEYGIPIQHIARYSTLMRDQRDRVSSIYDIILRVGCCGDNTDLSLVRVIVPSYIPPRRRQQFRPPTGPVIFDGCMRVSLGIVGVTIWCSCYSTLSACTITEISVMMMTTWWIVACACGSNVQNVLCS